MLVANPAAHLHRLLSRFAEKGATGVAIRSCWASVLNVDPDQVEARLGAVIGLVPQIEAALKGCELDDQLPVYQRHARMWTEPMFFTGRGWGSGSHELVDEASLDVLSSLASAIRAALRSRPKNVPGDQVHNAMALIRDARDAIIDDHEIPDKVRRLILRRLADVEFALEEVASFGADGVENAVERLLAGLAQVPATAKDKPSIKRLAWAAAACWAIFTAGPQVQQGLESWGEILGVDLPTNEPMQAIETDTDDRAEEGIIDAEVIAE